MSWATLGMRMLRMKMLRMKMHAWVLRLPYSLPVPPRVPYDTPNLPVDSLAPCVEGATHVLGRARERSLTAAGKEYGHLRTQACIFILCIFILSILIPSVAQDTHTHTHLHTYILWYI